MLSVKAGWVRWAPVNAILNGVITYGNIEKPGGLVGVKDEPDEDIAKLPQVLKDAMIEESIWGTFRKDEIFNSEFQSFDLPESIACEEYFNTTYDKIRDSDEKYLARLDEIERQIKKHLK